MRRGYGPRRIYDVFHPRHAPSEGRQQVSNGKGETHMPLGVMKGTPALPSAFKDWLGGGQCLVPETQQRAVGIDKDGANLGPVTNHSEGSGEVGYSELSGREGGPGSQ